MQTMLGFFRQTALFAVITLALIATGFQHRMPTADDTAMYSFVLAGGDLADICADADGDGLPDQPDCPACHIVGIAHVPTVGLGIIDADLVFVASVIAPRESRAVRAVLDTANGLRAPPVV
jgi:hypothetical protein